MQDITNSEFEQLRVWRDLSTSCRKTQESFDREYMRAGFSRSSFKQQFANGCSKPIPESKLVHRPELEFSFFAIGIRVQKLIQGAVTFLDRGDRGIPQGTLAWKNNLVARASRLFQLCSLQHDTMCFIFILRYQNVLQLKLRKKYYINIEL